MKEITLINGPYHGRTIEDCGAVRIRMSISTNGECPGAQIGEAIYEPAPDRVCAFWLDNNWLGTLEGVIDA